MLKWESTSIKKCQVCGQDLGYEPLAYYFSHILGKGAFPKFKLWIENIWLKCLRCHTQWDAGMKSDPRFEELRNKEEELKMFYHQLPIK
jgi:hypothetical protein